MILGRRLTRVEPDRVELDDGKVIATATVISTVGNAPNPALAGLAGVDGALDSRGWVLPDATFAVPGLERVWALGDCASIIDPGTGRPWPATAQHAVREGPHAARNVLAVLDGRLPTPFDYSQQGMLVSLGRFRGVGEVRGIKVSGFIAWFLWRGYYLLQLPSLERRIRVALDWALELFLAHDVIEINMRRTRTRPGEIRRRDGGRARLGRCPPGRLRRDRDLAGSGAAGDGRLDRRRRLPGRLRVRPRR